MCWLSKGRGIASLLGQSCPLFSQECVCDCRLKVSGPYYSEFKALAPEKATDDAAVRAACAAAAVDTAGQSSAGLTPDAVRQRVESAVAAVMGSVPCADDPLVEAGLDSLGEALKSVEIRKQ